MFLLHNCIVLFWKAS